MTTKIVGFVISMLLIAMSTVAVGDWDPEDGHKMHFPQLPDPLGWDVYATAGLEQYPWVCLADDWLCSETGWVKDIHFWGSWFGDHIGNILSFTLAISADIPADQSPTGYSMPGETLWEKEVLPGPLADTSYYVIRGPYEGAQGWLWSFSDEYKYPDHNMYFQYNVFLNEKDWFFQEEGTIYWLCLSAMVQPGLYEQPLWGWKSSVNHWNDDAVRGIWYELEWMELFEPPEFQVSLDLAFVITGGEEPTNHPPNTQ